MFPAVEQAPSAEMRLDLQEKQWYTLAQLKAKHSSKSQAELEEYWAQCIPAPPMPAYVPPTPVALSPASVDEPHLRETRAWDRKFAELLDRRLNETLLPLFESMAALCQHAARTGTNLQPQKLKELKAAIKKRQTKWEQSGLLRHKGLHRYEPQMLALYTNTLEAFPVYEAWRQLTRWSDQRAQQTDCEHFLAAVRWMTWLDQSLALLPLTEATVAYRVVKGFRYADLLTRFAPGRRDLMWYEPKSVSWNSMGCNEGELHARQWAGEQPGQNTIFIIDNFTGHDISWLSDFDSEHEAMTRALTMFEVTAVRVGDPNSDDVLAKCDQVRLRQLPLERREPITCRELNTKEAEKFARYVKKMKLVELFERHFEIQFEEDTGASEDALWTAMKTNENLKGFACMGSRQAFKVNQKHKVDPETGVAQYTFTLFAYNMGVVGYDCLFCRATQKASFSQHRYEAGLVRRASTFRGEVRESAVRNSAFGGWAGYIMRMLLSQDSFDERYDVAEKSKEAARPELEKQREDEKDKAFENVLCGYILQKAIKTKRLVFDQGNSGKFRLLGKPADEADEDEDEDEDEDDLDALLKFDVDRGLLEDVED